MTIQKYVGEIRMHEKRHGPKIRNTNVNRQSTKMCQVNCPHGEKGGVHIFHVNCFPGGGCMFSMAAFSWGGGCFKAPMNEGMDGIRRAEGWVGHRGG